MKRTWVSMVVGGLFAATAGSVVAQEESTAIAEQKVTSGKPAIADAAEFTPQQRAVLAEKLRLVSEIVARMEPQARADGLAPGWRQSTMSTLYALSNETLAGMMGVRSVNDLPDAIAHAKRVAPKALGSSTEDVVYTPITPCRYIDTRDVGGKISGTRSYDLDLNSYTFSAIKCASDPYGIFGSTLAAVAVNLAIVDPSGAPGFATIVPHQAATNVALMNWYEAGPTVQASNSAIVTINPGGLAPEIDIHTSGPVHAIVDVFGAFRASGATALQCSNTANIATPVLAGASFSLNAGACPTGYTSVSVNCRTSNFNSVNYASVGANTGGADCQGTNISGGTITMNVSQLCCRVPGR